MNESGAFKARGATSTVDTVGERNKKHGNSYSAVASDDDTFDSFSELRFNPRRTSSFSLSIQYGI
jgi:hypothetical protein